MFAYTLRRIVWSVPVILLLVFAVFILMRIIPGGPFDSIGERPIPPSVKENLERQYHLDWATGWQFSSYLIGDDVTLAICSTASLLPGCDRVQATADPTIDGPKGILRGDLGYSLTTRRSVNDIVAESFPISFQLGVLSIILAMFIGIPAGILSAIYQNSWVDYTASFIAVLGLSIPNLVLGPLLILIVPLTLGWFSIATWGARPPFVFGLFPTSYGPDFWSHAVLPTVTLGTGFSAAIARLTRASLLQVIREDYIRTARAKGLREQIVVVRHALKNSLIPVITVLGPLVVIIITGTFVVEQIFGIPGMGKHFVTSIGNRDYTIITGVTFIYAVLLVVSNLVVDLTYGLLDPRIRYN